MKAERLPSIDVLRGIVMILMALDHVRDFFTNVEFSPLDPERTTPLLFFTRWITHYCAPTFVFLAGTSAFLSTGKKTRADVAKFLLVRGIVLVLLELTVVRVAWTFEFRLDIFALQVIWAIGMSMIVLAALVRLPDVAIFAFGLVVVLVHNAFDGVHVRGTGALGGARDWTIALLHEQHFPVVYPLVPWIGVIAIGFVFGRVMRLEATRRRRTLVALGLAVIGAFGVLRALAIYGDPHPFAMRVTALRSVYAFLDTRKYPPSLLFLLMTLGPSVLALGLLDRHATGRLARIFAVYGRAPLFYYVAHLYVIHGAMVVAGLARGFPFKELSSPFHLPDGFGFSLGVVYAMWIAVVVVLYPACAWFARAKAARRHAWLAYF